ncbi:hypothetical protein GCM10010459_28440 [Microbacterium schleiferi]
METLKVLKVLGFEPVVDARRRAYRDLSTRAESYRRSQSRLHSQALVDAFREEHYGVRAWVTRYEGRTDTPWIQLAQEYPRMWRRILAII